MSKDRNNPGPASGKDLQRNIKLQIAQALLEIYKKDLKERVSSARLIEAGLSEAEAAQYLQEFHKSLGDRLYIKKGLDKSDMEKTLEAFFKRNGLGEKEARQAYAEFSQEIKESLELVTIKSDPIRVQVKFNPDKGGQSDIFHKTLQRWEGRLRINEQAYRDLGYWFVEGPPASYFYTLEYAILKRKEAEDRAKKSEARATKAERTTKALQAKNNRFRLSGHLPEQMLKGPQLNLFEDPIENPIKGETTKTAHLDLSATESVLVLALGKLLHHYSQTDNPNKPDYYLGNRQDIPDGLVTSEKTTLQVIQENAAESLPVPQMMLPTYQIAWEYMGKKPSGPDIETVANLITQLSKRFFRLTYKREITGTGKKGKEAKDIRYFNTYQPLIFMGDVGQEYTESGEETENISIQVITFNPIFIDQIRTKWHEYPEDYIKRIREAWPGRSIPKTLTQLGLYLNQIRSQKNNNLAPHTIYTTTLLEKLDPVTYKKSKKRAIEQAEKSLDCCKECGFIESWTRRPGQSGETLYEIYINKKW